MKNIKSLSELQEAINRQDTFFQDIQGRNYNLHIVTLLSMSLLDVIKLINEKRLYHSINM